SLVPIARSIAVSRSRVATPSPPTPGPRSTASIAPLADAVVGAQITAAAATATTTQIRRTEPLHRGRHGGSAEPIGDPWCSRGQRTSREQELNDDGTLVD